MKKISLLVVLFLLTTSFVLPILPPTTDKTPQAEPFE